MQMSSIIDRYILKSLLQIMTVIAIVLSAIILLSQSLKFLELIMSAGASSAAFWALSALALPRLFEIILPLSMMIGTLFIYHRLISDSELTVMRAVGCSPMRLTKPLWICGALVFVTMLMITCWLAPTSLTQMKQMRHQIKEQYSTLIFREGIFTEIGDDITVYVRERSPDGTLSGLLVQDNRVENEYPVTILAQTGVVIANDDQQQVVVYNGSRQLFDQKNQTLQKLNFDRYVIDFPQKKYVYSSSKEADERTIIDLLTILNNSKNTQNSLLDSQQYLLFVEIIKRLISPLLPICFSLVAVSFLLLGTIRRQGNGLSIFYAIIAVLLIQGLYLASYSMAQKELAGLIFMVILVFLPIIMVLFTLGKAGDHLRYNIMRLLEALPMTQSYKKISNTDRT